MRRSILGLATCALMTASIAIAAPAQAVNSPQSGTVTADPANFTPHVLDGDVFAVAEVGDTIVLGGKFTSARNAADGSPAVARSNLLAFNKTTGVLSETFAPVVNDAVRSLVASADGTSVYVAGQFGAIDGRNAFKLARLDVRTGQPVAGFNAGRIDSAVMDVRLNGDRLFISGKFTNVAGSPRSYLAELAPDTGALRSTLDVVIDTPVWSGTSFVNKTDVTPDGTRMVVLGNFRNVGGQPHSQIAMLDLTTNPATVMTWASPAFDIRCGSSLGTGYDVRDVDFSPDGSYFTIGATGGHTYAGAVCDGVSRWETNRTGPGQQPTWLALTGGDSVYSVANTGSAVYAGGHFRWFNNPVYVQSYKGPGAVDREGIAALDPVTGVPLRWNPGRDRGQAVWDLLATPSGLWVGNDTDRIGRYEYHARIAFFPLAGGTPVPQPATLPLPVDTQLISPVSAPDALVRRRGFTGTTAGPAETLTSAGTGWSTARGAFVAEGHLYTVSSDRTMTKRPVTGSTYGTPANVDLNLLTAFANELPNVTSMFYGDGRLYYTLSGANNLYMRFFVVESDIVGATRYTVASGNSNVKFIDWRTVRGAFLVQGQLYIASSVTGNLSRVPWADRAPASNVSTVVSGPTINGIDWRSAGLFVRAASTTPTVSISQTCTGTRCALTGEASNLGTATVASWAWSLGDGTTRSTQVVDHDYAPGTYQVTLTITTSEGVTATSTASVTVANAAPVAAFTVSCAGLVCSTDATGSTDADGLITNYAWDFGDGTRESGAMATHTYAGGGARTVTLVVTDARGATSTTSAEANPVASPIAHVAVAANTAQTTSLTRSVTIPASTVAGDTLVMFWSANALDSSAAAPAGWQVQGTASSPASTTRVWTRTALAGDAGTSVAVRTGVQLKADLVLSVYRGAQVGATAVAAETVITAAHTTPSASVSQPGSWTVSYWADKSAATTTWTAPAGGVQRHLFAGSGTGHVSELLVDSNGPVPTGTAGGLVATADSAQRNATMATVVLAPTG